MSASGHATPAELLDAVYYASTVITIGPDPDRPGHMRVQSFHSDDDLVPARVTAAKLREAAEDLERGAL
ncbi:hypothetical protein [Nocardia aurantia]|uniref:Uncharacterized protein n=1 Tax=Nocardia aurantia TaxID=2585199 RepID=A0A7K0DKW3_9NOCA|nr:hypothetical protein [Nocardia aurantia]MQY26308.1 hypothetical protein [Nocardia aurantia]